MLYNALYYVYMYYIMFMYDNMCVYIQFAYIHISIYKHYIKQ